MAAGGLWQSKGAEIEARDDSERTQRTDEQFVQVVAGDILYDTATAFAGCALAVNKLRANQEIARQSGNGAACRIVGAKGNRCRRQAYQPLLMFHSREPPGEGIGPFRRAPWRAGAGACPHQR